MPSPPEQRGQYEDAIKSERARLYTAEHGDLWELAMDDVLDQILTHLELGGTWTAETGPTLTMDELHASELDALTRIEYANLRARENARNRLVAEQAEMHPIPAPTPLDVFVEENADQDTEWLVDRLWPADSRVMLVAAYKAGKTTLTANLVRALADGGTFLGRYPVHMPPPLPEWPAPVLLVDTEMTPHQLAQWLDQTGIRNRDRVEVLSLRGQLSGFNILEPATRAKWARKIEGARVVILDNLRPVLDALGLDENREAGRFLTAWDELIKEASAVESLIVTHSGHGQERARGDSALMASNAAIWTLLRDGEEAGSPRYFRALGRDVEVPESALTFDPATRALTLIGGNRRTAAQDEHVGDILPELLRLLERTGRPQSRNQIELALKNNTGHGRNDIRRTMDVAVADGLAAEVPGARNAKPLALTAEGLDFLHPETAGNTESSSPKPGGEVARTTSGELHHLASSDRRTQIPGNTRQIGASNTTSPHLATMPAN